MDDLTKIPEKKKGRSSHQEGHWCSTHLLESFSLFENSSILGNREILGKQKILDLVISPCRVSAKIYDELSRPRRAEILFKSFSEEDWDKVLSELAGPAYYLAKLLNHELPIDVQNAFQRVGLDLFPRSIQEVQLSYDGKRITTINPQLAIVIVRLCEKVDSDPFSLFTLRGRGQEETIAELKTLRTARRPVSQILESEPTPEPEELPRAKPAVGTFNATPAYYSLAGELDSLSYHIRADDLPAAIFKWLDPLPLHGLEENVEPLLEEAYAHVARRAQVFGLSL